MNEKIENDEEMTVIYEKDIRNIDSLAWTVIALYLGFRLEPDDREWFDTKAIDSDIRFKTPKQACQSRGIDNTCHLIIWKALELIELMIGKK